MSKSIKPKIAISSLPKSGWWPNGITAYEDNDMMSNGAYPNQMLLNSLSIDRSIESNESLIASTCLT